MDCIAPKSIDSTNKTTADWIMSILTLGGYSHYRLIAERERYFKEHTAFSICCQNAILRQHMRK
jgi:hypothetical protein